MNNKKISKVIMIIALMVITSSIFNYQYGNRHVEPSSVGANRCEDNRSLNQLLNYNGNPFIGNYVVAEEIK